MISLIVVSIVSKNSMLNRDFSYYAIIPVSTGIDECKKIKQRTMCDLMTGEDIASPSR
jgi:hypothetical protein